MPFEPRRAYTALTLNTLAFAVCFAAWTMNGVLVAYLVEAQIATWDPSEVGWLIGIPVLSGALLRLPAGVLTDRFGGRAVFPLLMIAAAVPMYFVSYARTFAQFAWGGLGFGIAGASFAVGAAYTSVWFPPHRQGTALGIFGVGNTGVALTSMGAPIVLGALTGGGLDEQGWRMLPRLYAAALVATAVVFYALAPSRLVARGGQRSIAQRLAPLRNLRVWRFGLYYFLVFGGFVALSQWLIPYYVNVYAFSVAQAGLLAACFSLPSGATRALGGWMADRWGARAVMYRVFFACLLGLAALCVPRMDIRSPGEGIMATASGVVQRVSPEEVAVDGRSYPLQPPGVALESFDDRMLVLPSLSSWHEPVVETGQRVAKRQLLAKGVTHIYFQANVWIFSGLVLAVGIAMGIGMAGVFKYIPDYFPNEVGVVGGAVGVIGGLGGFFCPIVFGYLLRWTGLWTTTWFFLAALSLVCLVWLHLVVQRLLRAQASAPR